jgi:hypothetical protein
MTPEILKFVKTLKELDAGMSIQSALEELDASNSEYGIIKNDQGEFLALIQAERLRSEKNPQNTLSSVVVNKPVPLISGADVDLDKVVKDFASAVAADPELEGVVIKENEDLKGVLPRRVIVKRALEIVATRGLDRLEGGPLDTVYFECAIDKERKSVDYYDPANPPKCRNGHPMKLVED